MIYFLINPSLIKDEALLTSLGCFCIKRRGFPLQDLVIRITWHGHAQHWPDAL